MENMINMPIQGNVIPHAPVSELRLYSGVPWDDTYEHVRLYESKNDLLNHLENWRVTTSAAVEESMSPIRIGGKVVAVPYNEMSMLNINYLAFRNNISGATNNEWVFCFVTNVEWRSENTTKIYFKQDLWQNNIYDATLKPCFIERSHIPKANDIIFSNLQEESVESGDNYVASYHFEDLSPDNICMYVSKESQSEEVEGSIVNNVYRAAKLIHDKSETNINNKINDMTGAGLSDAILNLFMAPDICLNAETNPGENELQVDIDINSIDLFEGYVPKNNKLYSYPYIYLAVDNNMGQCNTFRFEYFTSSESVPSPRFSLIGCLCTSPVVIVLPWNYNGAALNYQESLSLTGFPECAFQSDTYRAWFAQNQNSIIAGTNAVYDTYQVSEKGIWREFGKRFGGGIASALQMDVGGVADALVSAVDTQQQLDMLDVSTGNQLSMIMAQRKDKQILPPTIHGKIMNQNINAAYNITGISFYTYSVRKQFAQRIDEYWSAFGYPIREITTPDYTCRSSWNYIKTVGCNVQGKIDIGQRSALKAIFDRGVTVWHTDDVGNYNLNNN